MLTDEQVDELVRQVPFGREPYITFRAIFRAGMMKGARIAYGNSTGSAQCERIVLAIRAAAGEGEG